MREGIEEEREDRYTPACPAASSLTDFPSDTDVFCYLRLTGLPTLCCYFFGGKNLSSSSLSHLITWGKDALWVVWGG